MPDKNASQFLLLPRAGGLRLMFMPRVFVAICLLASSLCAQTSLAQAALAPPPGARVIKLTSTPGQFTEPSIAVNPSNPKQLVGAFQNTAVAYSRDAGQTWTLAEGAAPPEYRVSGDVSVVYDNHGHAFLCYIAFDKLGTENYWAHNATRNGIFVRRSLDGGQTWENGAATVIAHPSDPGIPFEDKPYLVADTTRSKFSGNLYVGWTEFTLEKTIMLFSRSTDGGKSWSKPIEISTHEGLPRDDNGAVEGFTGAVTSDGTLYVAWCDISGIVMAVSKDGGRTFSPSRTIIKTGPSYFDPTSVGRGNGFPQIAIDPRNNQLYVTWADYTNGDIDVFSSTSKDRGKQWSAAIRVNDDPLHNGHDQFFQWMSVDPIDGSENVIFCDRRADPGNRSYYMTLARSTDGGQTFKNYAWSTEPSDPKDVFMGDYMGITAFGGKVYGIWNRTATPEERAETPAKTPTTGSEKESAAKESKTNEGRSNETQKETEKEGTGEKHMSRGLFVEVGLADFSEPAAAR